jgi:hypothetical protein
MPKEEDTFMLRRPDYKKRGRSRRERWRKLVGLEQEIDHGDEDFNQ